MFTNTFSLLELYYVYESRSEGGEVYGETTTNTDQKNEDILESWWATENVLRGTGRRGNTGDMA